MNPRAGRGRAARLAAPVAARLRAGGCRVEELIGADPAETSALAREAVRAGVDGIVALGGDGLVNIALQEAAATPVPLGVVPAGTGNDIARALGLPADPLAACDLVSVGALRRVDAARAGGRWFAGVLGAGFDSIVNERANRMRWPRGRARYPLAVAATLRAFRPVPLTLTIDGDTLAGEATLVAVGNGSSYGGGMRVCPDARLDDGLLDVMVLGSLSVPAFLVMFPGVYSGRHVRHPAVHVYRAAEVTLAAAGVTAYADGERLSTLPVTCRAVPEAMRVFAPPGSGGAGQVFDGA